MFPYFSTTDRPLSSVGIIWASSRTSMTDSSDISGEDCCWNRVNDEGVINREDRTTDLASWHCEAMPSDASDSSGGVSIA